MLLSLGEQLILSATIIWQELLNNIRTPQSYSFVSQQEHLIYGITIFGCFW